MSSLATRDTSVGPGVQAKLGLGVLGSVDPGTPIQGSLSGSWFAKGSPAGAVSSASLFPLQGRPEAWFPGKPALSLRDCCREARRHPYHPGQRAPAFPSVFDHGGLPRQPPPPLDGCHHGPTPIEPQKQGMSQHTLPTSTLQGWREPGEALAARRWVPLATCLVSPLLQEPRPEDLLLGTTCGPLSELGVP